MTNSDSISCNTHETLTLNNSPHSYMTSADKERLFRVRANHYILLQYDESFPITAGTCIKVNVMLTAVFTSDAVVLLCQFSRYIMSMTSQKQTAVWSPLNYTCRCIWSSFLKTKAENLEIWCFAWSYKCKKNQNWELVIRLNGCRYLERFKHLFYNIYIKCIELGCQ